MKTDEPMEYNGRQKIMNNNWQQGRHPKQLAAGILSILLGGIGIGHFYTGQTLRGVLDILLCWTVIPGIIGLVEGIIWLFDSEEEWEQRVEKWNNNVRRY